MGIRAGHVVQQLDVGLPVLRGIDVSLVQGLVDWPAVAASGVAFAFCKVAEGTTYRDPRAAANLAGARAAGLVVGAYNVVRPSAASDPAAQARTHHAAVVALGGGLWGDLPHAVDFEENAGLTSVELSVWLDVHVAEMTRLLGRPPVLYTFPSWWKPLAAIAGPATARTALWFASYGADTGSAPAAFKPTNPVPLPWNSCRFWQYTDRGRLSNGTAVDADLFDGTIDELRAMCLSAATDGFQPEAVPPDTTPTDPPPAA